MSPYDLTIDGVSHDIGCESAVGRQTLGDFEIIREIGRGGMGVVYEAIQTSLDRTVALKILPLAGGLDSARLQRFRNEATAVAQLNHPNIVPVYSVGSDCGIHYFAMQMIQGETLASLIEGMRTDKDVSSAVVKSRYRELVESVVQAATAIEHAHRAGIVHRDLKPANLMRQADGKVWVTDFGLVQFQDADAQLTDSGVPIGTLRYMSPEQAAGDLALMDHRTDVYSLGVTLYELLTLIPAIEADGYHETIHRVLHCEPPAPRLLAPSLPVDLDTIVRKAIAKIPSDRYSSAQDFADDLQRWLDEKPIHATPPSLLEHVTKWRRRHRNWVNAAVVLLLVASLVMAVMVVVVLNEHTQTKRALANEREQRQIADENLEEARNAIDTFSRLSEMELAHHPELVDSRRAFLDTSLGFYRHLLRRHTTDTQSTAELEATVQRTESLLEEVRELEAIEPLVQLGDKHVRRDLGIQGRLDDEVKTLVQKLEAARREFAEQIAGMDAAAIEAQEQQLDELTSQLRNRLNDEQMRQLEKTTQSNSLGAKTQ